MNQFPPLLWGLSTKPLSWFVPLGRQSTFWVSEGSQSQVFFSTSMLSPFLPFSHMHTCGHEQAAQDKMYFENICPGLSLGEGSLSPLSLGFSSLSGLG